MKTRLSLFKEYISRLLQIIVCTNLITALAFSSKLVCHSIIIKLAVLVSVAEAERTKPYAGPGRGVEKKRSGTRGTH